MGERSDHRVRGLLRLVQLMLAIGTTGLTVTFDTRPQIAVACNENSYYSTIGYKVRYPFTFDGTKILERLSCSRNNLMVYHKFPGSYSLDAKLFATTGLISFLYTVTCLVVYMVGTVPYETRRFLPIADLVMTVLLAAAWSVSSFGWLKAVESIITHSSPEYIARQITICQDESAICSNKFDGEWLPLRLSAALGYVNAFMWVFSIWFVVKEVRRRRKGTIEEKELRDGAQSKVASSVFAFFPNKGRAVSTKTYSSLSTQPDDYAPPLA